MGQISKIFTWRQYFVPVLDASGAESFPPGFFTHFGRPTVKNFDSVFLTNSEATLPNKWSFCLGETMYKYAFLKLAGLLLELLAVDDFEST